MEDIVKASGVVDWSVLRRLFLFGTRRLEAELPGFWESRAEEFDQGTEGMRELTGYQLERIELDPDNTVLDVGSGSGRLALPIARRVRWVTALDFSSRMLTMLRDRAEREGINNISLINKPLNELAANDLPPHDVVIASFSLMMTDIESPLLTLDALAKKRVYLFVSALPWMERELQKRIFGRTITLESDFICVYNILHGLGIRANAEVWEYCSKQTYKDLEDAVSKFVESYALRRGMEDRVRGFLSEVLAEGDDGRLVLTQRKRIGTIWWEKAER